MSHNIRHASYPEKVNKKEVQAEWDEYVRMEDWQEGASGLVHPIRWLESPVYNSYDEAEKAIQRLDNKWYDQLAVKYLSPVQTKDEKLNEFTQACIDTRNEYDKRNRTLYASQVTSSYIGCKNCGSKLARTHLNSNLCPVCKAELRPEHMLKWVDVAKRKWEKACTAKEEWVNKHSKKEIRWLVKIEYHT